MSINRSQDMSKLLERLRIQTRFRELKKNYGDQAALDLIEQALRLEFASDLETCRPDVDHMGAKNSPVVVQ